MDNPDAAAQTFADFSDFLVTQAPNMSISTSSMSYAAHASADFDARVAPVALQLAGLGFAAGMQARPPIITAPSKRSSPENKCTTMLADPKTYSKAMLNAKDPLAVAGGSIRIAN